MRVSLLLFAQCRRAAGSSVVAVDLPDGAGLAELWDAAVRTCPALTPFRETARVAVNRDFADAATRLRPGDEVAIIPPVSGG